MMPDDNEIWAAVRNIGATKAPGPDGFIALFYQKYWRVVKSSVIEMVKSFFATGHMLRQLNHTNLVLIPKVENPLTVGQFHPISLCDVGYKIISKILAGD